MKNLFTERLYLSTYKHVMPYYYKTPEIAFAVASPCIIYEAAFAASSFEKGYEYAPNTAAWD